MKKLLLGMALLTSFSSFAGIGVYDFSEKNQIKCFTVKNAKQSVEIQVDRETFFGTSYPIANKANVKISVFGRFDRHNVNIEESEKFKNLSPSNRLATQVEYSLVQEELKVSEKLLSNLTGDETTPGKSLKLEVPVRLSLFSRGLGIAHVIYNIDPTTNSGDGFVSLDIDDEHYETIAVKCEEIYDSADYGKDYIKF